MDSENTGRKQYFNQQFILLSTKFQNKVYIHYFILKNYREIFLT